MAVFGTVSFHSDAFWMAFIQCIAYLVAKIVWVLESKQCELSYKIIIIFYFSSYVRNVSLLSRAEIYDHTFGVLIIWDDTIETRYIENTSLEYLKTWIKMEFSNVMATMKWTLSRSKVQSLSKGVMMSWWEQWSNQSYYDR